jgi:hypothetical protein
MKNVTIFDRFVICLGALLVYCLGCLVIGCGDADKSFTAPTQPSSKEIAEAKVVDPGEFGMKMINTEDLGTGYVHSASIYTVLHPLGKKKITATLHNRTVQHLAETYLYSEGYDVSWQDCKHVVTTDADDNEVVMTLAIFEQTATATERSRAVIKILHLGTKARVIQLEWVYQGHDWMNHWHWPLPDDTEMSFVGYDNLERPIYTLSLLPEIQVYERKGSTSPVVDPDLIDAPEWLACVAAYGAVSCVAAYLICDLMGDPWSSCSTDACIAAGIGTAIGCAIRQIF